MTILKIKCQITILPQNFQYPCLKTSPKFLNHLSILTSKPINQIKTNKKSILLNNIYCKLCFKMHYKLHQKHPKTNIISLLRLQNRPHQKNHKPNRKLQPDQNQINTPEQTLFALLMKIKPFLQIFTAPFPTMNKCLTTFPK